MSVDLVVACYRDSLEWVNPLLRPGVRAIVYDKGVEGGFGVGRMAGAMGKDDTEGFCLPNVGLCDHSYLHHIVRHYDTLADWTVFSPDAPHDHLPEGVSMADALTPGDSLRVPRLWKGRDWGPDGRLCWQHWGSLPKRGGTNWKEHYESGKVTPAALSFVEWMKLHVGFDPNGIDWPGYSPGGIYAVPRQAITYLPREFYVRLREQLSASVEPEECHYMERAWVMVFRGLARYVPEEK